MKSNLLIALYLLGLISVSGCDGDLDPNAGSDSSEPSKLRFIDSSLSDLDAINYADVDGDGDMDLLAASSEGELYWYQNNGEHGFKEILVATGLYFSYDIDVVDFDQDGRLDILTINKMQHVIMLSGQWQVDSIFEQKTLSEENLNCHYFCELASADFNNDGILDLLHCGYLKCQMMVFEDNEKVRFEIYDLGVVPYVTNLIAADYNGDGWVDYSYAVASQFQVEILTNQGVDGKFSRASIHNIEHGYGAVAIDDINQDGVVDIVGTKMVHLGVSYIDNLEVDYGSLQFTFFQREIEIPVNYYASSFAVMDIDLDGDNDIVSTNTYGSYYFLENGDGHQDEELSGFSFDPERLKGLMKTTDSSYIAARPIRIVDMDNNGRLDLISNQLVDGKIMWGDIQHLTDHPFVNKDSSQ